MECKRVTYLDLNTARPLQSGFEAGRRASETPLNEERVSWQAETETDIP